MDGDPDHERQRETAVDDTLAELRLGPAVLLVEMQIGGIVGQRREPDIVGFRDGTADGVLEDLADLKLVEIGTGHHCSFLINPRYLRRGALIGKSAQRPWRSAGRMIKFAHARQIAFSRSGE